MKVTRKSVSVVLIVTMLLLATVTVVACNPTDEILPGISSLGTISDASIDNTKHTINVTVSNDTTGLAGLEIKFDSDVIAVEYGLFEDAECKTALNLDTYTLKEGENVVYVKVWQKDNATNAVVYKLTVLRKTLDQSEHLDSPQDVVFGSSDYQKPQRGDITMKDCYDVFKYAMSMAIVALNPEFKTIEDAIDSFLDEWWTYEEFLEIDGAKVIHNILAEAGLTHANAEFIMDKMEENEALAIEAIALFGDFDWEAITAFFTNPEKVAPIMDLAKEVFAIVDEDMALTVLDAVYMEIFVGEYGLDECLFSYLYDFSYNDLLEEVAGSSYVDKLEDFMSGSEGMGVPALIKTAEIKTTVSAAIRVVNALLDYDVEKLTKSANVALDLAIGFIEGEMDFEDIFSKDSDVSLKDIVGSVNMVGDLINTILDACEEDPAFMPAALKILQIVSNNLDNMPLNGAWQLARMAANLLEKVTVAEVSEIYADYDDFMKASEEEATESLGYLIAHVAQFIDDEYAKLGEAAKAFVFDNRESVEKLDSLMALCTSKELDKFTVSELKEIATLAQNLVDFDSEEAVSVIEWSQSVFVPVGANDFGVLDAVAKAYPTISQCNVADIDCDTSKVGYTTVTIKVTEESQIIYHVWTAFVYDEASLSRFSAGYHWLDPWRNVFVVAINKGATVDDEYENDSDYYYSSWTARSQLVHMMSYLWLNDSKTYKAIDFGGLFAADDMVITGVDTSKTGWGIGLVTFKNVDYLKNIEIPFAYYVVDNDNPQVTGIRITSYASQVLTSHTADDVKEVLSVEVIYDYNDYEYLESLDEVSIIGIDTTTPGRKTLKVSYKGFTDSVDYVVVDEDDYYNLDNWTVDDIGRWDVQTSDYDYGDTIDGVPHFDLSIGEYVMAYTQIRYSKDGISKTFYIYVYPNFVANEQSEILAALGLTATIDFDFAKGNSTDYTDCYFIITKENGDVWYSQLIARYKFEGEYNDSSAWSIDVSNYVYGEPEYYMGCSENNNGDIVYAVSGDPSNEVNYVICITNGDVTLYVEYFYGNFYISYGYEEFYYAMFECEVDFDASTAEAEVETPCYFILKDKAGNEIDRVLLFYYTLAQ